MNFLKVFTGSEGDCKKQKKSHHVAHSASDLIYRISNNSVNDFHPTEVPTALQKLTQIQVKAKADEWASIDAKIRRAQAAKEADLEEVLRRHKDEIDPICEKHDPKIKALYEKKFAIEKEVLDWLNTHGQAITLAGEKAVAANETKIGNRVISPKRFFEEVKERTEAFWGCMTVGIAKAEELLGKAKIDALSEKPKKIVPSLTLK